MCVCVFVKLAFEMSTVHRQQHLFSTNERMFLWKSLGIETREHCEQLGPGI